MSSHLFEGCIPPTKSEIKLYSIVHTLYSPLCGCDFGDQKNVKEFFNIYRKLFYSYWLHERAKKESKKRKKIREWLKGQRQRVKEEYGWPEEDPGIKPKNSSSAQPALAAKGPGKG